MPTTNNINKDSVLLINTGRGEYVGEFIEYRIFQRFKNEKDESI